MLTSVKKRSSKPLKEVARVKTKKAVLLRQKKSYIKNNGSNKILGENLHTTTQTGSDPLSRCMMTISPSSMEVVDLCNTTDELCGGELLRKDSVPHPSIDFFKRPEIHLSAQNNEPSKNGQPRLEDSQGIMKVVLTQGGSQNDFYPRKTIHKTVACGRSCHLHLRCFRRPKKKTP